MNIWCLDALGIPAEQYGCFLISIIMPNVPEDIRLHIVRVTTRDVWNVSKLMRDMKVEVRQESSAIL